MTKTLTLSLTGDTTIIDAGLDSFCRGTGWVSPLPSRSVEVSESQRQWARDRIRDYIRDTAAAWNAQRAAELARQSAAAQTGAALGTLTLTLSVE